MPGDFALCRVLIVDDDAAAVAEYAEVASSLGYDCVTAVDARDALRLITEDRRIGIVITDMQMPAMDGLSFLDELSARFSSSRPIVAVVITGFGSLELAVDAMRLQAADFLTKPVTYQSLAQALRRALRSWTRLTARLRSNAVPPPEPAAEEGRMFLANQAASGALRWPGRETSEPTQEELVPLLRSFVGTNQQREEFLDPDLFSDPAWNILLDLASARLENKPVPVSSACVAARVPMSTALRHIRHLVADGYVKRWQDPSDRRRDLLMIEERGMKSVMDYLAALWKRWRGGVPK